MPSICMPVDTRPPREPDALCEGCGARGTIGRASRHNDSSVYVEEHRYCADCWPQWSAFYRQLWEERGSDAIPPEGWGMVFVSATWHGAVDFVNKLTENARHDRNPLSRETLTRFAAEIRDTAAERVGPMPLEVRQFLAEFGAVSSDAPAADA
jgi:hypothetical protein